MNMETIGMKGVIGGYRGIMEKEDGNYWRGSRRV